jgi:hypothetical protein
LPSTSASRNEPSGQLPAVERGQTFESRLVAYFALAASTASCPPTRSSSWHAQRPDLPATAALERGAARDTLGSVVAASEHLPDPLAGQLVDGAREAFVLGFRVTAVTTALIAKGTAVLIAVFLRRAGTEPDVGEETLSRDSGPAEVAAVEEAA